MQIRASKFVSIFLIAVLLLLPVRYVLAISPLVAHNSSMEMTQDIGRVMSHAAHADIYAALAKREKHNEASSCDGTCFASGSCCPHIDQGIIPVFTPSANPDHGVWLNTTADSVGINSPVEISPPKHHSV